MSENKLTLKVQLQLKGINSKEREERLFAL